MKQLVIRVLKGGNSFIHMFSINLLRACSILGAGERTVGKVTGVYMSWWSWALSKSVPKYIMAA